MRLRWALIGVGLAASVLGVPNASAGIPCGPVHLWAGIATVRLECGTDCEDNLLLLGVAVATDNTACTDCRHNTLNVGISVLGDNDQCASSSDDPGGLR